MKLSVLALASCALPAAVLAGACSSSSSSISVIFPTTAQPYPTGYIPPGSVPGNCAGETYFEAASALCKTPLPTYFLCDGMTYTEYDCVSPGAGWTVEPQVPDTLASGGGSTPASSSARSASSGSSSSGSSGSSG